MAESDDVGEKHNGVFVEQSPDQELTLYGVLRRVVAEIFFPDPGSGFGSGPLLRRIKGFLAENIPLLRDALKSTSRDLLLWTRRGTRLRALLVVSVGTVTLLVLTGLFIFMLFFLAATINAIVISLLMSLAAAGGFLALFFAFMTAIYIGALSVAVFIISTVTISAIIAVVITTGWIGFFWTVWLATKKSVSLVKHSLTMTGSALSAYSSARHARRYLEIDKVLD
ncbi:Tegument protein [Actinidia chinensis var. chinensis]|uniref:Tegument protein n=1 Tax=Actinidia chinensis var. chinensis TaxID=1590841 RepID=A0A2R6RJ94_ACTCC|nr:Tegument protein [Actinidia chinensis var. chinensis]